MIIATGFYDTPRKLGVKGEKLPKVKHYYDDSHLYIDQHVAVIGAANSACDVALETWQKGAKSVTMIVREHELYPKVKYWILPNINNRIENGEIHAYFNSNVVEINNDTITFSTPEGVVTIDNDYVLAMIGYMPDYDFLQKTGVDIEQDGDRCPVYNKDTFESNIEGLYIAGVVQSGLNTSKLFIENTRHHGEVIVNHILSKDLG